MKLQFRLRTLMIVVTLLAVPLGYVGWQAKIVRERKAIVDEVTQSGGWVLWASEVEQLRPPLTVSGVAVKPPYLKVSYLRRLLGDDSAVYVFYSGNISKDDVDRIRVAFPESHVELYDPPPLPEVRR